MLKSKMAVPIYNDDHIALYLKKLLYFHYYQTLFYEAFIFYNPIGFLTKKTVLNKFKMADPRWRLFRHNDVIIVANDN